MSTYEVPRDRWEDFLSAFSGQNQTRNITLDLESNELGPQRLVDEKPLLGIEPDFKDNEAMIMVVAGDPEGGEPASLTHEISRPTSVWVKEDEEGHAQALDIESEDGKTIIQFV